MSWFFWQNRYTDPFLYLRDRKCSRSKAHEHRYRSSRKRQKWFWAALLTLLLLAALIWAVNIYGGRKYLLTNKRLILKRGIIKRNSLDLILRRCEGVSISQSIMGRILDYGTVIVSTGEVSNSFSHIENPVKFSSMINQQIADINKHAWRWKQHSTKWWRRVFVPIGISTHCPIIKAKPLLTTMWQRVLRRYTFSLS